VAELDHVDENYRVLDALGYVILTLPQRTLELAPVTLLLGTLIALATLARHNELTAMAAAGVTRLRLLRGIAGPTFLMVALLALVSEYVSAPLYQLAETRRGSLRSGGADLLDGRGLWSKDGRRIVNVRELRLGRIPSSIELYEFRPDGALQRAIHADHAFAPTGTRRWTLVDVDYTEWTGGHESRRRLDRLELGPFWLAGELPVLSVSTAAMSLSSLHAYIAYLEDTGQDTGPWELALWRKAVAPPTAGVMALLAVPVGATTRPGRRAGFGRRMAAGVAIGLLFYLGARIIQAGGQLLGLDVALIALTPPLAVLCAGGLLFYRMRW